MSNNSLIEAIEELLDKDTLIEKDMTKPDTIKNPQEEEVEESSHEEEETTDEELSAKQKKLDKDGDGKISGDDLAKVRKDGVDEEADCEEEIEEADLSDDEVKTLKKVAAKHEEVDEATDCDEEEEVEEATDCDEEEVAESEECDEEDEVEESTYTEPETVAGADPDKEEINKAEEPKPGKGKMTAEAEECDEEDESIEELTDKQEKLPPALKNAIKKKEGEDVKEEEECDEEDEVEESAHTEPKTVSGDPDKEEINKAEEPKSGSGKVPGKDGALKAEATDCDEEEEVEEAKYDEEADEAEEEVEEAKDCDEEVDLEEGRVDTIRYERSHSKKPKGRGRWLFSTERGGTPSKEDVFSFNGDYKEAEKKAIEWAKKNDKGTVYVMEEVEESFDELDEDFKEKASIIFETAVNEKVNNIREEIEAEYETKLQEETAAMNEQVSEYIDYAVQEWLKENALEIKYSLRTEIAENFITGLKGLFEESYIEIPDDEVSVVDELTEAVESYKEQLEEQQQSLEEANAEILNFKRQAILESVSEDLTQTQAIKLEKLSENVEAGDIEEFEYKLAQLKESFFSEEYDGTFTLDEEIVEPAGEYVVEGATNVIDHYASFLSKTSLK